jgi:hypothetical protein
MKIAEERKEGRERRRRERMKSIMCIIKEY